MRGISLGDLIVVILIGIAGMVEGAKAIDQPTPPRDSKGTDFSLSLPLPNRMDYPDLF